MKSVDVMCAYGVKLAVIGLTGFLASCCSRTWPPASKFAVPEQAFQLYILKERWDDLRLGYTSEESWAVLSTIALNNCELVITENDIETYDWVAQSITLNEKASTSFENTFEGEETSTHLFHRAFVVTLQGERLYGGVFLDLGSPMAIRYPVIHVETHGRSKVLLKILPEQLYISMVERLDRSLNRVIEFQEVHDLFQKEGKLQE